MKLSLSKIKAILKKYHFREWQLALAIGVNTTTFNTWSHTSFKGHVEQVKHGLHKLINSKAGDQQ